MRFRGLYNLCLLEIYQKRAQCYVQFGQDPVRYYACFDGIERVIIKDKKAIKELQMGLEDELTICRYDCKQVGTEKVEECMRKCQDGYVGGAMEIYEGYYREKVGNRKEYEALRKGTVQSVKGI
jgi:hypothetical protein